MMRVFIYRPGGIWWDDRRIVDILGHSFTDTYNEEFVTNWSNASPQRRDAMFNFFSSRVRMDPGYGLRAAFDERIKTRITVPINRAYKSAKRPPWKPFSYFERLLKRRDDPH